MKLFIISISCILLSACAWFQPKYKSGLEGQKLPDFKLTMQDSAAAFNTTSISEDHPFIIFLYRTTCPFCQMQTDEIVKNIKAFHDIPIYFITADSLNAISAFSSHYNLVSYPEISMLRDSTSQLAEYFNVPGVPYLAFYSRQKKLNQVLVGKLPFADIQKILSDLQIYQTAKIP